ncbi:MAG TPA: hypothetical protein PKJ95_03840 [Atribacterota bacterium]|nr:hypothetical protein [Atribacterota bacterium]
MTNTSPVPDLLIKKPRMFLHPWLKEKPPALPEVNAGGSIGFA